MKHLYIYILLFSLLACYTKKENVPYLENREVYRNGSIFYNQANCASCHGIEFKGKGLKSSSGKKIPNFRRQLENEKTPLDYFQVLTYGLKNKSHIYQNYTDKGRWALAYYLYSLSAPPKNLKKRNLALQAMRNKVKERYKKSRRWASKEKEKKPKLEDLLP